MSLIDSIQVFSADGALRGTFATIQDAVNGSQDGDTICVPSGVFSEVVAVNKSVTILGANAGVPGTGMRGAESDLEGAFIISADGVTIDGFEISEGGPTLGEMSAVYVQGENATIINCVLVHTGSNNSARGVLTATNSGAGLTLEDNLITGFATGVYLNPGSQASVTGNTLRENNVGLSDDGADGSQIFFNRFEDNVLEQIGIGADDADEDLSFIRNNSFSGDAPEIAIYPIGDLSGPDGLPVPGTRNDDVFNGSINNFDQVFDGGRGDDVINGGGGDDDFAGGKGNDMVNGGGGADTIRGDAGRDVLTGGEGADLFVFGRKDGFDVITDFEDGVDLIGLEDYVDSSRWPGRGGGRNKKKEKGEPDVEDVFKRLSIEQVGDDVHIEGLRQTKIVVENATVDQFSEDDFMLL